MGRISFFLYSTVLAVGSSALTYYLLELQREKREKEQKEHKKLVEKFTAKHDNKNHDTTATHDNKNDKDTTRDIKQEAASTLSLPLPPSMDLIAGIIKQLWENSINPAASTMVREILQPMLKETFPTGLMSDIEVMKCNLGATPLCLENITVHEVVKRNQNDDATASCQFNMDIVWDSNCEMEFNAPHIGSTFGIKAVKFFGRMSFIMKPLTKELPCVGGISYSFINPPHLSLTFTGLASVAEFALIDVKVKRTIQDAINSMVVLPYRMSSKINATSSLMDIYEAPISVVRISIPSTKGFQIEKRGFGRTDDIPDVYAKIKLGGNRTLQTNTIPNCLEPNWENQYFDFILYDYDQILTVHFWDEDKGVLDPDDDLGTVEISIRTLCNMAGRSKELPLIIDDKLVGAHATICCDILPLANNYHNPPASLLGTIDENTNHNMLAGIVTVLVTQAFDIPLERHMANTFVSVNASTGESFDTGIVKEVPGVDALNPVYDCVFEIPLVMTARPDFTFTIFQIGINDKGVEEHISLGNIQLSWSDIQQSNVNCKIQKQKVDVGDASLEFSVMLRGVEQDKDAVAASFPPQTNTTITTESTSTTEASIPPKVENKQTNNSDPSSSNSSKSNKMTSSTLGVDVSKEPAQISTKDIATKSAAASYRQVKVAPVQGRGFVIRRHGPLRKKDIPDVYLKIKVGETDSVWKTSVIRNNISPKWENESKIFKYKEGKDLIVVSAWDKNSGPFDHDDYYGKVTTSIDYWKVTTSIDNAISNTGGSIEFELVHEKKGQTGLFITIACSFV